MWKKYKILKWQLGEVETCTKQMPDFLNTLIYERESKNSAKEKQFTIIMGKRCEEKVSRQVFQIHKRVLKPSHIKRSRKIKAKVVRVLVWQKVKPPCARVVGRQILTLSINIHNLSAGLLDNSHQNLKWITVYLLMLLISM